MHATILFALLAVTGTNGYISNQHEEAAVASPGAGCCGCQQGCSSCDGGGKGGRISMAQRMGANPRGSVFGMMPQTCYNPPYGCYAPTRFEHRYPAFHGHYYRNPYNYRNYFDYPWHAEMHEPTSLFSYNTESNSPTRAPLPAHARTPQRGTPLAPVTNAQPRPTPVKATPVTARQNWAPVTNVGR